MENVIFLLKSPSKAFSAHGAQNVLGVLKTAFPLVLFACLIRGSWLPSRDSSPRIIVLHPLHISPLASFPLPLSGGPSGAGGEGQKLEGAATLHSYRCPFLPLPATPLLLCIVFPSPPPTPGKDLSGDQAEKSPDRVLLACCTPITLPPPLFSCPHLEDPHRRGRGELNEV